MIIPPRQRLHENFKPIPLKDQITKLILCEKLFRKIPTDEQLRLISAHLLLLSYFELSEQDRILRYLETSTEANNELKTLLEAVAKKKEVSHSVASNCLHILAIKAECLLLTGSFEKGVKAYAKVCHLYNQWNYANSRFAPSENATPEETNLMTKLNGCALDFGVDDYIKARAGLAECLMNSNRIEEAIQKFESVKRRIEQEVVFDKPILFINICNQLGNCYLRLSQLEAAKDNFEQSLRLISKVQSTTDRVNEVIMSKIYLNLGIIATQ